ncbi:hypothetical protein [Pseudomonas laurentiana]
MIDDVAMDQPLVLFKYDVEMPEHVNLALVIMGDVEEEGQRHTGFVMRDLLGGCWLFHLGWNNHYFRSPMSEKYNYLLIPILEPETETVIVAFLCMLLSDTEGKVPYSIAWEEREYFDVDGKLVDLSLSDGFTCATFVLETLKRFGLDMVDRSTWPIPAGDAAWQERILERVDLSREQFNAQVALIGKRPRFRPEQALGAAHYYRGTKLCHAEVVPAGRQVISEMVRLRA